MSTRTLALFDLDDTILVHTNSLLLYVKYLVRKKEMPKRALLKGVWLSSLHKLNLVNIEKLLDHFVAPYANRSNEEIDQLTRDWFSSDVKKYISKESCERIIWHKNQGHITALLSSASQYICEPVRDFLQIDHVMCSTVEVRNGLLTGKFIKPLCYQEGKIYYARKFAEEQLLNLKEAYFYSDSISDLPMLLEVGNPVAINPDPLLKRQAKQRGWPIEYWKTCLEPSRLIA